MPERVTEGIEQAFIEQAYQPHEQITASVTAGLEAVLALPEVRAHRPERGSDVETWLKRRRDEYDGQAGGEITAMWMAVDSLLEDYRLHADTGAPLDSEVMGPMTAGVTDDA